MLRFPSLLRRRSATNARRAFTLLEAVLALTVCAVVLSMAVPRLSAMRDASAVRAAMTELGALFSQARQSAISRRVSVAVLFDTAHGNVLLRSEGRTLIERDFRGVYGVHIGSDRDSTVYDARGLGYGVANVSVNVRRGNFVDTLTMSRLGRVRW